MPSNDEYHTHEETNGISLSAYGNRVLVNGGWLGDPTWPADKNNTISINGSRHGGYNWGGGKSDRGLYLASDVPWLFLSVVTQKAPLLPTSISLATEEISRYGPIPISRTAPRLDPRLGWERVIPASVYAATA